MTRFLAQTGLVGSVVWPLADKQRDRSHKSANKLCGKNLCRGLHVLETRNLTLRLSGPGWSLGIGLALPLESTNKTTRHHEPGWPRFTRTAAMVMEEQLPGMWCLHGNTRGEL